jgi:hypothetical protein
MHNVKVIIGYVKCIKVPNEILLSVILQDQFVQLVISSVIIQNVQYQEE